PATISHAVRSLVFASAAPPPPEISTLSLHDALPIFERRAHAVGDAMTAPSRVRAAGLARSLDEVARRPDVPARDLIEGAREASRSEEHTSELQSRGHLVCRLLLEKKIGPRVPGGTRR